MVATDKKKTHFCQSAALAASHIDLPERAARPAQARNGFLHRQPACLLPAPSSIMPCRMNQARSMPTAILSSKLFAPPRRPGAIRRERLLRELHAGLHRPVHGLPAATAGPSASPRTSWQAVSTRVASAAVAKATPRNCTSARGSPSRSVAAVSRPIWAVESPSPTERSN
jgi:hypothetical protein